jgi:hypothetical protein
MAKTKTKGPVSIRQLTGGKKGEPIIPKITAPKGSYVLVDINEVHDNPGQVIYVDTSRELGETPQEALLKHYATMAESIGQSGLEQIPVVFKFKDGVLCFKSGMTRREVLRRMGATHIPVTIIDRTDITYDEYVNSDEYWFDKYSDTASSNIMDTERKKEINQYKQMLVIEDDHKNKFGKPLSIDNFNKALTMTGLTQDLYDKFQAVKDEWPEMYDKLLALKKTIIPAYKELVQKRKQQAKTKKANPAGFGLVDKQIMKKILNAVAGLMFELNEVKLMTNGQNHDFLNLIQTNIRSGLLHEAIVHSFKHIMNDANPDQSWESYDNMTYDLLSTGIGLEIDVKTRILGSKDWTCKANNIKSGFYLFVEANDDMTQWFVAYGYTKAEDWDKKNTMGMYNTKTLIKNIGKNMNILIGSIDSKGKLYTHPIQ